MDAEKSNRPFRGNHGLTNEGSAQLFRNRGTVATGILGPNFEETESELAK